MKFFSTLFIALRRGARAVFQFYPENPDQISMLTCAALRTGFTGGIVVDYPNSTKAKKYYLCLFSGPSNEYQEMPARISEGGHQSVDVSQRQRQR